MGHKIQDMDNDRDYSENKMSQRTVKSSRKRLCKMWVDKWRKVIWEECKTVLQNLDCENND